VHPRHGPTTPATGGAEGNPDWWAATLYTQIDDAHGLYEFCEPKAHHNRIDPRQVPGWAPVKVVGDPLAIVSGSHYTVVVGDVSRAASLWTSALGASLLEERHNELLGTRSSFVRVGEGSGTIIEFAEPIGPGPAAADRAHADRDVMHCVTFLVDDLASVRRHLTEIGCQLEIDTADMLITDPAYCRGARYGFSTASIEQTSPGLHHQRPAPSDF
jgi:hypothetical protein